MQTIVLLKGTDWKSSIQFKVQLMSSNHENHKLHYHIKCWSALVISLLQQTEQTILYLPHHRQTSLGRIKKTTEHPCCSDLTVLSTQHELIWTIWICHELVHQKTVHSAGMSSDTLILVPKLVTTVPSSGHSEVTL